MKRLLSTLLLSALAMSASERLLPVEDTAPGAWFLHSVASHLKEHEPRYRARLDKLAPPEARARLAEDYLRTIEEKFIANRQEDAAIERALGWKTGDFTWHHNLFYARVGCTSWLVTPELSETGACMLQKNRDYTGQNLLSARLYRAAPGRYKILTVGDLWSSGAGAVMNERGVMITQNDAPASFERSHRTVNVGSTFLLRYLAEHCATAQEALDTLRRFYAAGIMRDGDIYFIADPMRGFVAEATSHHVSAAEVPFAFEVRANNYLLPGMRLYGTRKQQAFLNGANRRYTASEFLRHAALERGAIGPLDLMRLSRLRDPAEEKAGHRQVCMKNTIASTMMVPDRMHPDLLSVAFVSLGPPRHTIFLPIPMALTDFPEDLANGDWGLRAFALADKLGLDHDRIPQFEALELQFLREFQEARHQARLLLRQGRRPEAVQLLNQLFHRQYRQATDFLLKISR
jgi:hypothetical protein